MAKRLQVLVVGASIAGPATAYWLARAGAQVTVIERFPDIRQGGQAIDIRGPGVTVMRRMPGMEEMVRLRPTGEEGVGFVREDGRPWGVIRATGNPDQQSLVSEFEIFRSDLSTILHDLTNKNPRIQYIFDEQLASLTQDSTGSIQVQFASGRPAPSFDLVVAADGATSRTRAMGLGSGVQDHIHPSDLWAAYFSTKKDFLNKSKIGYGVSAPGGRSVSAGSKPAPQSGGHAMFMSNGGGALFRKAAERGEEREFVAEYYRDVGWITNELIEEMSSADDFYASEILQVKVPQLFKGRFVLVGDAGYATGPTGFGTSIALAGAYILAGEISKHPDQIEEALQAYEAQMRPLIKEMQKTSPLLATILAPQSAWGIWLRNHIFALVAWSGIAELLGRLFGGAAFGSPEEFPLPEYKWQESGEK